MLLVPVVLVWFFKGFYKEKTLKTIMVKVLAVLGLTIAGYLLFILLIFILVMVIGMLAGPEALQYVIPK